MENKTRRAVSTLWPAVLVLLALVLPYAWRPALRTSEAATTAPPQDLIRVESRLSQLEQRFYSIETTLRGLEHQMRLPSAAAGRGASDPQVALLRAEVDALRRQLAEVECGLAKVDERTLAPAAREARRKSGPETTDPCRLDANAPLRLPTRP